MKRSFLRFTIIIALATAALPSYGQGWVGLFGTPEHEFIRDAIEVPGAGYAFTGNSDGRAAAFRLDVNGDSLWANFNLVPADSSDGRAIVNTTDGGLAIAGEVLDATAGKRQALLARLDAGGAIAWLQQLSFQPADPAVDDIGYGLLQTADGGFLLSGASGGHAGLLKTDAQGNVEWRNTYGPDGRTHHPRALLALNNGNYAVAGYFNDSAEGIFLLQTDPAGNQLGLDSHASQGATVNDVFPTGDGGFLFIGRTALYKLGGDGSLEWAEEDFPTLQDSEIAAAAMNPEGEIMLAGPELGSIPIYLTRIDQQGNVLWSEVTESPGTTLRWIRDMDATADGGYLLSGEAYVPGAFGTLKRQFWLSKVNGMGQLYTIVLQGSIYHDENLNCQYDEGEQRLSGQYLQAEGAGAFYGLSDANGRYTMRVDTGSYMLSTRPAAPAYWEACPTPVSLDFPSPIDTFTQDFGLRALSSCPYMEVDLSAAFLRRCFESTYTVSYCNQGTAAAPNAFVEVTLDPFLTYLSSTLAPAGQQGDTYTFNLGEVGVNECGSFQIQVEASCDAELGQAHCSEAHIYPDTLCLPEAWAGPAIEVEGACLGDSIRFDLLNIGAPMNNPHQYIVTEDNIILMQAPFQLGNGEERTFTLYADGSTYRLEAEQAPGYPPQLGNSKASVSIEGCNGFAPGFVTIYPEDDGAPYFSIDCQENRGAFDPNDKRAYPAGYGEEHFVEPNTGLEYHIRFQNTGTDTAFTVVIRDTLDAHLDAASVRPGASSHPYAFEVYGNGILEFTFRDILLPDSTANEPASHGFVKFRVAQKPDLEQGAAIYNSAGIYFDFNAPVITNETWHTIGKDFIQIVDVDDVLGPEVKTTIAPNPFTEEALIKVEGLDIPNGAIRIYNLQGQLVHSQAFRGSQLILKAGHLPAGLYHFRLESGGRLVSTGKIAVQ